MKRRVLIAKALIHEPKILFLDEPTAGVDIEIRKSIWEMINSIKNTGVTIILTSHYLQEVEEISDMISVIKDGEIKITDTKKNIFDKFSDKKYIFHLDSIPNKKIELNLDYKIDYEQKTLEISQKYNSIEELFKILSDNKIKFNDIQTNQSNLEDIFKDLIKRN